MSDHKGKLINSAEELKAALEEIRFLIENSEGITGFHGEGRLTTWSELRENSFLETFDKVLNRERFE